MSVGPSVGPLVGLSVGPSVENAENAFMMKLLLLCVYVRGGWGEDGGWMPLPTRPQQWCDPPVNCFTTVALSVDEMIVKLKFVGFVGLTIFVNI